MKPFTLFLSVFFTVMLSGCNQYKLHSDNLAHSVDNPLSQIKHVATATDYRLTLEPQHIVVVGQQPFEMTFSVTGKNQQGKTLPFTGLTKIAVFVTNQHRNAKGIGASFVWQSHVITNTHNQYNMICSVDGANSQHDCTLREDKKQPGTYHAWWQHQGNAPVVLANGDPNNLHRVMIQSLNVTDFAGKPLADNLLSTPIDFIPATGQMAKSQKDSVSNSACRSCHLCLGGYDEGDIRIANLHKHDNYQKVENCIACHNSAMAATQDNPKKGFSLNWNAMIHTLHSGNKMKLNGEAKELFGGIDFSDDSNKCQTCHDNGQQWRQNIYAQACVSCHNNVNFNTGENHAGIIPTGDEACTLCHSSGRLSPNEAHSTHCRKSATGNFVIDIQSVKVTPAANAANSNLVITAKVMMNDKPLDAATYAHIDDYMTNETRPFLVGKINPETGAPIALNLRRLGINTFKPLFTGGVMGNNGMLTVSAKYLTSQLVGQVFATAELQLCASNGKIVKCDDNAQQITVANVAKTKYFNLTPTH
ncbi:hypothetical protein ACFOD0_11480 [Shewanella intestini]|uniref:Outer membrane cytochrome MtrC/MtrF-like domain-containing protein n=1 Tax=Shewanella intestini TaxID=2017544 RepID=A0ABS5I518_9GAMM|nr:MULTISPECIES: hypothetical protein [Shewanella]MBR9728405.1 hypothetical protein [Shewanella intestini]MRG36747.1 hypothetical protein [Shewanella sp. XMDDZSB0408]